jgi:MoaA/NifB/PqqE/SkfB family radical SAM enzyme
MKERTIKDKKKIKKLNNLILELNSACNNSCIYCYLPKRNDPGQKAIPFFKKELQKYAKAGIKNLDFTGGEPTLFPKLVELVSLARQLGYQNRTLVSNGRRLAYLNYCREIITAGITRFVFCLDGPNNKIFEKISGVKDSYTQVVKAIKNIKKIDKKLEVAATVVINNYNYKQVPEIIGKAIKLGVDFINIQHLLPYIKAKNIPCRRLPKEVIVPYQDSYPFVTKAIKKHGKKIKINVHFVPFCYFEGFEKYLEQEALKFDRQIVHFKGFEYNIGEHLAKGCKKISKCKKCRYNSYCMGFFESYKKELGIKELIKNGK